MINVKYTKTLDYFVITILPYLELFLKDTNEQLTVYSTRMVCDVLIIMFRDNINYKKMDNGFYALSPDIIELDILLSKYYDLSIGISISNPIMTSKTISDNNDFVCIFPKYKPTEKMNNITHAFMDDIVNNIDRTKYNIYILGDPLEKLNTDYGTDITNFADSLSYLTNCKLFITSESNWHYLALLCNCRNIIVYNTSTTKIKGPSYNPFNANVSITDNLSSVETFETIKNNLS